MKLTAKSNIDTETEIENENGGLSLSGIHLPKRRVEVDKVTDQTGTGDWYEGHVLFVSNAEVVQVPTRCRASNIYGAASRMPRAAKGGLPKMKRSGKEKRIHSIIVELKERRK